MRLIKIENILKVTITLLLFLILSPQLITFAQTVDEEPVTQPPPIEPQGPEVIQERQEPPWFYYWPQENLNPYGLSTMGEDKGSDDDSGSTLGRSTKRPSNLEVNAPSSRLQDQEPGEKQDLATQEEVDSNEGYENIIDEITPSANEPRGQIYTYRDEKGVLHVTNNITSIPPQYQQEALGGTEGNKEE
jgi:hypothetical protein